LKEEFNGEEKGRGKKVLKKSHDGKTGVDESRIGLAYLMSFCQRRRLDTFPRFPSWNTRRIGSKTGSEGVMLVPLPQGSRN